MEGVIKQAEESRARSVNAASRLHEEYLPLKSEVDRLRRECLGIERLPELHEEEGTIITPEYVPHNPLNTMEISPFSRRFSQLYSSNKSQSQNYGKSGDWTRSLGSSEGSITSLAPPLPPAFIAPPSPLRLVANKPEPGRPGGMAPSPHPGPPTPTFRSDFVNLRCLLGLFWFHWGRFCRSWLCWINLLFLLEQAFGFFRHFHCPIFTPIDPCTWIYKFVVYIFHLQQPVLLPVSSTTLRWNLPFQWFCSLDLFY